MEGWTAADYADHNARSRAVWDAFRAGRPTRVPVVLFADVRNWLAEPSQNTVGVTMDEYLGSPDAMLQTQILASEWIRTTFLSDADLGLPSPEEGWSVMVDAQNWLEAAWLGGTVEPGPEPHVRPFLGDAAKERLFAEGLPDPWAGASGEAKRFYEDMAEWIGDLEWKGIPLRRVALPYNLTGTDGPFTLACSIRGADRFLLDLVDDPAYALRLLDFLTEAILARIAAARRYLGEPAHSDGFALADDGIVLLSVADYESFVLPFHERLLDRLTEGRANRSMHLCGDAQRFFAPIQRRLGITTFDTGFPVDFATVFDGLAPGTCIQGGPAAPFLLSATPAQAEDEAARVLAAVAPSAERRFVLREGNALCPGTPAATANALFAAAERFGRLPGGPA